LDKIQALIAEKLKISRKNTGMSQGSVGISLGLDELSAATRISRYESGKHPVPLYMMVRLAHLYKVPLCWFFCDDPLLSKIIIMFFTLRG